MAEAVITPARASCFLPSFVIDIKWDIGFYVGYLFLDILFVQVHFGTVLR